MPALQKSHNKDKNQWPVSSLLSHLPKNMIIFLHGEDTYRLKQKLAEIIERYKKVHKSGLNLVYPDTSKTSALRELEDEMNQVSMFKEKKMAVLADVFSSVAFREELLERLDKFEKSEDVFLLYQEGKPDQRTALFKFLKKRAKCQEFESLSGLRLESWIKKEFEKHGTRTDPGAISALVEFLGSDLWAQSNEIQKLACFKNRSIVIREDVEKMVRSKIETDIFETIDAIGQKDKKKALELINNHIEKGDSPIYILSMISYQFRNLLIIKDLLERQVPSYAIAAKSGLHPFVVKKSYYLVKNFSFPQLKKIYQGIFQADVNVKTGRMEPETALEILIAEL